MICQRLFVAGGELATKQIDQTGGRAVLWSIAQPLRWLISEFSGTLSIFRFSLLGCVAVALAACDPVLDRTYMDEGAGANLYTTDQAKQAALLDEYFNFICLQASANCFDYVLIVQAGMNDIDQRCDGYLTWLDARRRDRAPVLAEMAAVQTAVHSIMTVTGSSPTSLDILTAAFGLATATYTQWNSRLLVSIENSTVQEVVYGAQADYRDKIKIWPVPDRPTAVYLLRNYLRLCMPITIEAKINTTTKLVQRGAVGAAQQNLVVATTMKTPSMVRRITSVTAPLERFPGSHKVTGSNPTRIGRFEENMSSKDLKSVLTTLCITQASDLGPSGSPARDSLSKFLSANGKRASDRITDRVFQDIEDLQDQGKRNCS